MFGIDIGINVASVTCATEKLQVFDYNILFGSKKKDGLDDWTRIVDMADAIVNSIQDISKAHPGVIVESVATIEEPIFNKFVAARSNPKIYFTLVCLYALIRNKLTVRGYEVYSVNPLTVKSTARRLAFPSKRLKSIYIDKTGKLTKKGMIRAFKKMVGSEPQYHTIAGRETLADSFFIAIAGMEKRKIINAQ